MGGWKPIREESKGGVMLPSCKREKKFKNTKSGGMSMRNSFFYLTLKAQRKLFTGSPIKTVMSTRSEKLDHLGEKTGA